MREPGLRVIRELHKRDEHQRSGLNKSKRKLEIDASRLPDFAVVATSWPEPASITSATALESPAGIYCGVCRFCKEGAENLCDVRYLQNTRRDSSFATHTIADARYAFPPGELGDDVSVAPLLCASLIGWRSLIMAGNAERLGIFGFGAAGHIVAQVARWDDESTPSCAPMTLRRRTLPAILER